MQILQLMMLAIDIADEERIVGLSMSITRCRTSSSVSKARASGSLQLISGTGGPPTARHVTVSCASSVPDTTAASAASIVTVLTETADTITRDLARAIRDGVSGYTSDIQLKLSL